MSEQEKNYEWLLDYQERSHEFIVSDWGCGMVRYRSRGWNNKGLILAHPATRRAWLLVEPDGVLGDMFGDDAFDMEEMERIGEVGTLSKRMVHYRFEAERFVGGRAKVTWMLHPDGSYYADEDGFGRTDDEEVNISAYIDTECRVVEKFRQADKDF